MSHHTCGTRPHAIAIVVAVVLIGAVGCAPRHTVSPGRGAPPPPHPPAARAHAAPALREYAVKFVCGRPRVPVVAPGAYFTAINVQNASDQVVPVRKRFSVALPGEHAGPVSEFFSTRLGPYEAMEIDCPDIWRHLRSHERFVKGFAVVQSETDLNVVAVYTAAGPENLVSTMDVERVAPSRSGMAPGCPDLVVERIDRPTFDEHTRGSVISATITNVGTGSSPATTAHLRDLSPRPGVPVTTDDSPTPPLPPGASVMVTFTLPYWVFDPDANLEVIADFGRVVDECDEGNNTLRYDALG